MADTVSAIESRIGELRKLPPSLHWFCPRQYDGDSTSYADVDGREAASKPVDQKPDTGKLKRLNEAKRRTETVISCLSILTMDHESLAGSAAWFSKQLDDQMVKCDVCVRVYYQEKKRFIEALAGEHDDDEVAIFAKILGEVELNRIRSGLRTATEALKAAAPANRSISVLNASSLFAIFEALSSDAVLKDREFIHDYLAEPFCLVQTSRILKLSDYVPAMGYFVFDRDLVRRTWALRSWNKMKRPPTQAEFWWVVQEPLTNALREAITSVPIDESLSILWNGIKAIVNVLKGVGLIRDGLRTLEVNVYRLALDHLQIRSPSFETILQVLTQLLDVSPSDFQEAMGAIPPTSIIEAICNAPEFTRTLAKNESAMKSEGVSSTSVLGWIKPFMNSLNPTSQPHACRALTVQLMDRFDVDGIPEEVRLCCFFAGLQVLSTTLRNLVGKQTPIDEPVERAIISEVMEVVAKRIGLILAVLQLLPDSRFPNEDGRTAMDVISNVLVLDCQCFKMDYDVLEGGAALHAGKSSSQMLWAAVGNAMTRNNITLARTVLISLVDLAGLEKFSVRGEVDHKADKLRFNDAYDQLLRSVARVFERISDFDPSQLAVLFEKPETASALVSGLFAAESPIYGAAMEVMTVLSSQSGRREAITFLLENHFETTMTCTGWAIDEIANRHLFGPNPRMIKLCKDMVDILCNSQHGIFATRVLADRESGPVETFYHHIWFALSVIFGMTETWGQVNDREMMKEFCRDTMQFAEMCFERCSVFANAIDSARNTQGDSRVKVEMENNSPSSKRTKLLEQTRPTLAKMVRWLRLRDEYLAQTLANLVCKILYSLEEVGLTVAEPTYLYIEDVAVRGVVKTILTPQQKAELRKALDEHLHRHSGTTTPTDGAHPPVIELSDSTDQSPAPMKAKTPAQAHLRSLKSKAAAIDLDRWKAKAKMQKGSRSGQHDEILSASSSLERFQAQQLQEQQRQQRPQQQPWPFRHGLRPSAVTQRNAADAALAQKTFIEKREREKQEKKARDQEQVARFKREAERSSLTGIAQAMPRPSNMMVSSESDEEDEDEDELDRELFGINKPKETSEGVQGQRESQPRAPQHPIRQGPVRKVKRVRNAKDMRARLAPDLSPLHRKILGWDFFHKGEFPPSSTEHDYSLVLSTFRTPQQYQDTFQPLLLLEAWQGFVKAKEEAAWKPYHINVAGRTTIDWFIEIGSHMPPNPGKGDVQLSEADIVLISQSQNPGQDPDQPHCLARVTKVVRKKNIMDITYRINPTANPMLSYLGINATVYGVKIESLTSMEREYGALSGLQYYDLCDEIIKAKPSPLLQYTDQQVTPILNAYKLNLAQCKAVRSAVDNDGFTLIQGPPGSGKTKTIVATVGALLTNTVVGRGVPIPLPASLAAKGQSASKVAHKKLLICAPSNAAVDELVMRLRDGITTIRGEHRPISIVRLGRSDAINPKVIDVTLEELVNCRLDPRLSKTNYSEDIHKLVEESRALNDSLSSLRTKLNDARGAGESSVELGQDFDQQKRRKAEVGREIDELRDKSNVAVRDADVTRRLCQQQILDEAHIICATLSGSGHEMFHSLNIEFDTVIIDEAAQSIELSALIPLKYGCSKCILVGDPKQLPPTVLSREAARFLYEQSLFVRMQTNHPSHVHLLDTQYRMHPDISQYPSQTFYDGRLLNGENMAIERQRPWHRDYLLGSYRFFDVEGQHQNAAKGRSLVNRAECKVAVQLYERLSAYHRDSGFTGKVGIITPYKGQLMELRLSFSQRYGDSIFGDIEFNTTDAFQGRESEIIIFSCVRASSGRGIGFLNDVRRMNVGLTRAKCSLWVLGNSRSLQQNECWGNLIDDARRRNRYSNGDLLQILRQPFVTPVDDKTAVQHGPDVEMTDAPDLKQEESAASRNQIERAEPAINPVAETKKAGGVSGGYWGLNANESCHHCGSFAHLSCDCDNEVALAASGSSCYRCGGLDHIQVRCAAPLCVLCGGVGHTRVTCVNTRPLSKLQQISLIKRERNHERQKGRYLDKQRQRQLGSHDPRVPVLRTTDQTLDSGDTGGRKQSGQAEKRKRAPSPEPSGLMPLKPANGENNFTNNGLTLSNGMRPSSFGATATPNETGPHPASLPLRPPPPEGTSPHFTTLPSKPPLPNEPSPLLTTLPSRPPPVGVASPKSATLPPRPPPPRPRKEVDCFIRPKAKRPRT